MHFCNILTQFIRVTIHLQVLCYVLDPLSETVVRANPDLAQDLLRLLMDVRPDFNDRSWSVSHVTIPVMTMSVPRGGKALP